MTLENTYTDNLVKGLSVCQSTALAATSQLKYQSGQVEEGIQHYVNHGKHGSTHSVRVCVFMCKQAQVKCSYERHSRPQSSHLQEKVNIDL